VASAATTICCGVAIGVSLFLPQAVPPGEQTVPPVPAVPDQKTPVAAPAAPAVVYESAWQKTVDTDSAVRLTVGATHLFVADAKSRLTAMIAADGTDAWTKDLPSDKRLATGDGMVFVVSGEKLYALDEKTGTERWTATASGATNGPSWVSGIVVISIGEQIAAFRTADGSEIWRQPVGAESTVPLAVEAGLVLTALANRSIAVLDLVTGTVRKRMLLGAQPGELAAAGNRLFFGAEDGLFYAYGLTAEDPAWVQQVRVKTVGAPITDDGCVFVTLLDNTVRAFKRGSGSSCWSARTLSGRPAAGPLLAGLYLIVPLTNADLVVIGKKDGRIVRGSTPDATGAPPVSRAATLQTIAAAPDVSSVYIVAVGEDQRRVLTARRRKTLSVN
jgi:outer membrane protein assembly factor BamB